jgi:hypothetical protein
MEIPNYRSAWTAMLSGALRSEVSRLEGVLSKGEPSLRLRKRTTAMSSLLRNEAPVSLLNPR